MSGSYQNLIIALLAIIIIIGILVYFNSRKNTPDYTSLLLNGISKESGRPVFTPTQAVKFKDTDQVYLKSALDIDFSYRDAWVKLPLYRGISPGNKVVNYIITEASDPDVAIRMGLNYAPKMKDVIGSNGAQQVQVDESGLMYFKGNVDFSPKRQEIPDPTKPFPPLIAKPGAVADSEWSSFVVLPNGIVLNAQMVANETGLHDRVRNIDTNNRTVNMIMLDGYQGGRQYFYHLVTDASAELPSTLEKAVFAPKLAKIPTIGESMRNQKSALLGFSPVLNGPMTLGQEQGFQVSIANNGIDPINVFPFPPQNQDLSQANNYSPMWDAAVSQWTDYAVKNGLVRRITGFEDLGKLVNQGLVTSANISPPGPGNPFVFGLRPTQVLINCPIIAHPILTPGNQ